jgi:hypothetical protein
MLAPLVAERDSLMAVGAVAQSGNALVQHALATSSPLERGFWLASIATLINGQPATERRTKYQAVARRIHATFAVPLRERHDAVRAVAEHLVPLA